jgi:predicted glycoside hydrolase/deacetylase ChbG (UPF0249 family)
MRDASEGTAHLRQRGHWGLRSGDRRGLRSSLNRARKIIGERLRGGRHLVLQRCVLLHPDGDAAIRILLLRQGRLMQDGGLRDLNVIGEIPAEVKALVAFFGRVPEIADQHHHIRDIFRVADYLADKIRAAV